MKKVRCVYSNSKMTPTQTLQIEHIKDTKLFTCGSPLFPDESRLSDTIVVREAVTCASPIETQYYAIESG